MPPSKPQASASALHRNLLADAKASLEQLLSGVNRYQSSHFSRTLPEPPVIWRRGSARLLDYSSSIMAPACPPLLFIPSLINRYYVLDLTEKQSLARYLSAHNVPCFLLDWGEPGAFEREFGCAEYVTRLLIPALEFLHQATGRKITLAGYCMGGVLALALAQLKPRQAGALALLATPWDFHAPALRTPRLEETTLAQWEEWIMARPTLPAEWIQMLFYLPNPWLFQQKFRRFAGLQEESAAFKAFLALEHWVNDGVPMTAQAARDCFIGWAQRNILARKEWRVEDTPVDPARLRLPVFAAVPAQDQIVPSPCAMPLVEALRQVTLATPSSGHVGMIVGGKARKETWEPFLRWNAALHE